MSAEMFDLDPLTPALGARVLGVDLSQPPEPRLIAALRAAWLAHRVLVFPEQSLTPAQFVSVARYFGEVGEYPFVAGMAEQPEIVEVIKLPHETHNFGGLWHTDTSYLERPPMASLLHAVDVPPLGGDTLFSNTTLAFSELSSGMQRMLSELRAISSAGKPDAAITRVDRRKDRPKQADEAEIRASHPVVRTHPETKERALYLSPGHVTHFEGLTEQESAPLLQFLFRHMVNEAFTARVSWRAGDLAIWDNRCTLHNALNDYQGHRRVMHRIVLEGDAPT